MRNEADVGHGLRGMWGSDSSDSEQTFSSDEEDFETGDDELGEVRTGSLHSHLTN